jgi:hypothetical protein
VSGTAEIIETLIREVEPEGVFQYSDLLPAACDTHFNGIAISYGTRKKIYILFLEGNPEGAVLADSKGELYGDKAIYLIERSDRFTLCRLNPDLIERVILSCRIYDKSHFTCQHSFVPAEFGKKYEGVGRAIIALKKDGVSLPGFPIRIRKDGQIVANDISDINGLVSFRLLYGKYEVLIVRSENNIDVFEFSFIPELQGRQLELEIP